MIYHIRNLIDLKWYFGFGFYKNKPMFLFNYTWYDGPLYCVHIGPFWFEAH